MATILGTRNITNCRQGLYCDNLLRECCWVCCGTLKILLMVYSLYICETGSGTSGSLCVLIKIIYFT